MRIRGAKTELEEAGLETDGMAESTSKLREEILALSGVDIMIDDSTFKSTYDIVLELAQIWDTLTDVSQANISELLAGKRGGNVINSLMTNADLLEETYATALGSEGSAEKELENYQQGVQYSIDVFKASWEELSNTILSSDLMKTVIDIGSGIVSTVNSIISSLGGVRTVLAGITSVAAIKNLDSIKELFGFGNKATQFTVGFTSGMSSSAQAANGLSGALGGVVTGLGKIAPYAAVFAAVGGSILAVYEYATRMDKAVDKAATSISEFQDAQTDLESLESDTNSLKTQLESLADTYKVDIGGLDDVDAMIDKIESSADTTLSITDKATLEDLRAQNTELERQIALQEQVVDKAQTQSKEDARNALNMRATTDLASTISTPGDFWGIVETYEETNIIDATRDEINALRDLKQARNDAAESLKTADKSEIDGINKTIDAYDTKIGVYENAISEQIETLGELKGAFDETDSEYQTITQLEDAFANIDLSPLQQDLASLDSYFSTDGMDAVKNAILDAVAAGENASDVFQGLGLSLDSISEGLDVSTFDAYFNDLIAGAEEAGEAIESVEGTVDSMSAAADTANQNANWESAAKLLSDAKDLYKNGLIGTDDFKEAAQYMSPEKLLPNEDDYKYDANAYVKAWEDAQSKVKRYFDTDNPATSMTHALDDLTKAGLAINQGEGLYEWTDQFKNSKQAADAFGISVAATEDILHGLEAYGADISDIFLSGEGLEEYETYLEGIRSVYDSIGAGDTRDRIGTLLEGFDEEYEKYQEDITGLDNEAIVRIKFEYDLANLDSEIEGYRTKIAAGDTSAATTSEMYSLQKQRNAVAAEQAGLNVEGVEVPIITKIDQKESDIQAQIEEAVKNGATEEETVELRTELSNLEDVKGNILDAFNDSEYAINVDEDTTATNVKDAWDAYLSSGDMSAMDVVANLSLDDTEAIQELSELTDMSPEEITETVYANTSPAIGSFASLETLANDNIHVNIEGDTDSIKSDLDSLSTGNTLVFTADVGDVETAIAGVKSESGEIYYTVNEDVDTAEAKKAIAEITGQDEGSIVLNCVADTDQALSDISELYSEKYDAVKVPTELNTTELREAIDSVGEDTTVVKFEANVDGISREVSQYTEEDGTVIYSANINGVETELKPIETESGTIVYTAELSEDIPDAVSSFIDSETLSNSTTITVDVSGDMGAINSQLESLSLGHTLIFTADISGVETAVAGIETVDGEVTYTVSEDVDVDEAKKAITEITGQEPEDIRVSVAADTNQAMQEIDRLVSTAQSGTDLEVNTNSAKASIQDIKKSIDSIGEGTQIVNFRADVDGIETAVSRYQNTNGTVVYTGIVDGVEAVLQPIVHEDGTITYTAEINGDTEIQIGAEDNASGTVQNINSLVNAMDLDPSVNISCSDGASSVISSVSGSLSALDGKTATTHIYNYTHNITTNSSEVNGTAHASGTAKATGDVDEWSTEVNRSWMTKKSETALTGELGRELVVDTKNNRWYTVGDNGAEFTYIPAGSIVFNHKQTEDLLTTGSTTGTAHASGTAYGGGVQIKTSSSSSSSKSSSSSSSSKSSSSSSSKKKSSSSSKKKSSSSSSSSKDFEESLDWIEIEIDRIERAINRLDLKAESTYNSWTTRNKNLSSEIAKITNEINVQQKAYDRYIKQANSVGLSSKYVKLVQNGTIDISTITDEDLADQIKEYQQWYYLMPFYCIGNRKLSNCWDTPKLTKLKHKDEINLGVNVAKAEKISQMI